MAVMRFGNFPVDMTDPTPDFLIDALNGFVTGESVSPSMTAVSLSNGSTIFITGNFDLSSEAAFLASSVNGITIFDIGGMVFSLTGLPAIPFSRLLELSEDEIVELASSIPVTIHGSGFNDKLTGGLAGDTLLGNEGDDVLTDNAGNDTLNGGAGNDSMAGGSGNDTYVLDSLQDSITELPGQGTDTVSSPFDHVLGGNFENLTLTGAAITGTGNAFNNVITGNALGNVLDGGAGNDTLAGGAGDDTYYVDSSGDVVVELNLGGDDTVFSTAASFAMGANAETLILLPGAVGGTGNALGNVITGNAGNNVLDGGAGNDVLQGGRGYDSMTGGTGNDTYYVNRGDGAGLAVLAPREDRVLEALNAGTDTVVSTLYTYSLEANVENLVLEGVGRKGFGNALNNALTGNGLNNTFDGGAGNDTLEGGAGTDRLTGGLGNDNFAFDSLDGSVDRILDYNVANDTIQLSFAGFLGIGTLGSFDATAFVSNAGGTAESPEDRIVYNSTTGALYYDADGNGGGAAVQFALLSGAPTLTNVDFAVIA